MTIRAPASERMNWCLVGIKILLLTVSLTCIAALLVPALGGGSRGPVPVEATRSRIAQFESALEQYKFDHDVFPNGSCEEVAELLMTPSRREGGKLTGPYIEELPRDKHGQLLHYEWPNTKVPNRKRPAIWSEGLNHQDEGGNGDDVSNWK